MKFLMTTALLSSALFGVAAATAATGSSAWQQLAKTDLDYVYQQIKANHPGVIDNENPAFSNWLEQGYQQSQQDIVKVTNLKDLMNIHRKYFAGFADGHLYLQLDYMQEDVRWPGMIVQLRQGKTTVTFSSPDWPQALPPIGAELVSCDGLNPEQWLEQRILPFRFNLPTLKAARLLNTPYLLKDDGIGSHAKATQCIFVEHGEQRGYPLVWRGIDETQWRAALSPHVTTQAYTMQQIEQQQYWLTIPGFSPDQAGQQQLKTVIKQLADLPAATLVVFDLRGNRGGNSQWGVELATALYGEAYVYNELAAYADQARAYWRASADNTAAVSSFLPDIAEQFGKESTAYVEFSQLSERMAKADARQLVPQSLNSQKSTKTAVKSGITPRLKPQVILFTDLRCGSACLDFADIMLKLPGVIHAGQPTWADTVYMDIRSLTLPSKLGSFSIPQKVYRNRIRGNNQPYEPQAAWTFEGDIGNDTEVKNWLLQKVASKQQ